MNIEGLIRCNCEQERCDQLFLVRLFRNDEEKLVWILVDIASEGDAPYLGEADLSHGDVPYEKFPLEQAQ